jgi:uncharacterized protein (DUF1697 family)
MMTTYISILRGINVGGHKMVNMEVLRQLYSDLGFANVQTYIQSGNILFQCRTTSAEALSASIGRAIVAAFGFEVPVLVMESSDLKEIVQNNPFVSDRHEDIAHLHVTFLSAEPPSVQLQNESFRPDEFVIRDKVVYLFCPKGYGNTKLNNNFLEQKLHVTATTRNWKTTVELLNKAIKLFEGNK